MQHVLLGVILSVLFVLILILKPIFVLHCIESHFVNKEIKFANLPTMFKDKKVSEYDQEIPQSQTAYNPWRREEEPHNTHETPGRHTKQSNQLSLPHQDDCKTRRDIK